MVGGEGRVGFHQTNIPGQPPYDHRRSLLNPSLRSCQTTLRARFSSLTLLVWSDGSTRSILKKPLRGVVGRHNSRASRALALLRDDRGIVSSPDRGGLLKCARRLPDKCSFTVLKDICSASPSHACTRDRLSPTGTHRGRGCEAPPTTPSNPFFGRGFPRTTSPPLCGEGTREGISA